MRKSKRNRNFQVPTFIDKLVQLLEVQQLATQNESSTEIISWSSTRDYFIIKNVSKFVDQILPKYYKHRNYSSFVRQLNMYGFTKKKQQDLEDAYSNINFKRGNKLLLKNIRRKSQHKRQNQQQLEFPNNIFFKELKSLKSRQQSLENLCDSIVQQNDSLLKQNNDLKKIIIKHQKDQQMIKKYLLSCCLKFKNTLLNVQTKKLTKQQININQKKQQQNDQNNQLEFQMFQDARISNQQDNLINQQNHQKNQNKYSFNNYQKNSNSNQTSQNKSQILQENQNYLTLKDFLNLQQVLKNQTDFQDYLN